MNRTISIKNFRSNLADIADEIEDGNTYIVIRRSKPAFKVVPLDVESDQEWETIVDFTEGGKKEGMSIKDVLSVLKKLNR